MARLKLSLLFLLTFALSALAVPKLEGHWAEREIKESFMEQYFPSLAQNDYQAFSPNGNISAQDFQAALWGLLFVYGFQETRALPEAPSLSRKEAGLAIGVNLADNGLLCLERDLPDQFADLERLPARERDYLLALSAAGLLTGYSSRFFAPAAALTQSQAVVLLQRVEGFLANNSVPFKLISSRTEFAGCQQVLISQVNDKIQVAVTRQFPTLGYRMQVKRVSRKAPGEYLIYLAVQKPAPGAMVSQVINYQTAILQIDRDAIPDEAYSFAITETDKQPPR